MALSRSAKSVVGVDIVVPIYNAAADVAQCVASVWKHTEGDFRLILINDASPDNEVETLLEELTKEGRCELVILRNAENMGFTKTANRGMRYDKKRNVVLLNSDTIVTHGWLNALQRCAASDSRIGTITPFSNNAEICSYPEFCVNNAPPKGKDLERICAALVKAAVPTYPDIPTGVGFCLYLRRALIDVIGVFDEIFGAGYGEENDFCLRAHEAGFRNVLCDDAFVVHTGGRSFVGRKNELSARNMPLLLSKYPAYQEMIQNYIRQDPLLPIRFAARLEERKQEVPQGVLHILHTRGGGTERHVRNLLQAGIDGWRQYMALVTNEQWQIEWYEESGDVQTLHFAKYSDESWEAFVGGICATLGVELIHVHHLSGCREGILEALATLPLPYGYTVHDLDAACPTITMLDSQYRYCGAPTDSQTCEACLVSQSVALKMGVSAYRAQHRAFVEKAEFLLAPSHWAATTFEQYFPGVTVQVVPHALPICQARSPQNLQAFVLPDDEVPTVAVLGAIGPNKGARRLERLVALARVEQIPIRFVLIGYTDRQHEPWQSEDGLFTVHGYYEAQDLPALMDHYRVRLVLFPSLGPETFSYTLSEAWWAGCPVLVPPLGALAERVEAGEGGWVMTQEEWSNDQAVLARLQVLLPLLQRGDRKPVPTVMVTKNMGRQYDGQRASLLLQRIERFPQKRIQEALGYKGRTFEKVSPPSRGRRCLSSRWLRYAIILGIRLKQTALGRLVYRATPHWLIEKLKNHESAK